MSRLDRLRKDWDSLAQRDALAAILTDQNKAGGKWSTAEFMATGDAEVETVLRHLSSLELTPDFRGAALDFGCGVGRLTQALARTFPSCIGIDISQEMIHKAESLNRYDHCQYFVNVNSQLPFSDESFSFIYSNIALQHIPPRVAVIYLREFARILAPGGVMVFGVQDSFASPDLASWVNRLRLTLHPRSRIRTWFKGFSGDMQMHCLPEPMIRQALGSTAIADIRYTNTAAKDFNGRLVYLEEPPRSGYIGRQYCARKPL